MTIRKIQGNKPLTGNSFKVGKYPGLLKFILKGGTFEEAGLKFGIAKQTVCDIFHLKAVRVFPQYATSKNKCDLERLRQFYAEINGE